MSNQTPSMSDPYAALDEVLNLLDRGAIDEATTLALHAVNAGMAHPNLFSIAAAGREARGEFEHAAELLECGLELAPNDVHMLVALGMVQTALRNFELAHAAFEAALLQNPDFAPGHQGMGAVLVQMGDSAAGVRHHERAHELMPDYADPVGSLAALAARRGEIEKARAYAREAISLDANQFGAREALALSALAEKKYPEAEAILQALIEDPYPDALFKARMNVSLGDAIEGQHRHAGAFDAYSRGKAGQREIYRSQFQRPGYEGYLNSTRRIQAWFEALPHGEWAPERRSYTSPVREHVFLVGFPRSGTTLLETMLAGHPAVVALDERPSLLAAAREFLTDNRGLERLAKLQSADAERVRQDYWESVRATIPDLEDRVLVDKFPLGTVNLSLIDAIFPNAKVLFAIRDPRDVVFSCFRRAFSINPGTYEFTTLTGTANLFHETMILADVYAKIFKLDIHHIHYEKLVDNFEVESRRICEFINIPWNDGVINFAKTARGRDIRTPSARQLVHGLQSGEGQWRPYSEQLAPIMSILEEWIERHGYAP